MSQSIPLTAEKRSESGTRASRRLRAAGKLPAVVYGHHQENTNVTLPLKETVDHLHKGAHLFDLQLDGTNEPVLVKDIQFDHLGEEVLHLDLFRVNLNEEVTVEVSIVLKGEPAGVKAGGILTQNRDNIEVVCTVSQMPDQISVDVSGLQVGQALHVSDLQLPEGVRLAHEHDAEYTIAIIQEKKVRADDDAAEEPAADVAPPATAQTDTE